MSNISIKMDMSSKHVHFYPGIEFYFKDQSRQKVETWNKSFNKYSVDNQANKNTLLLTPTINKERPFGPDDPLGICVSHRILAFEVERL